MRQASDDEVLSFSGGQNHTGWTLVEGSTGTSLVNEMRAGSTLVVAHELIHAAGAFTREGFDRDSVPAGCDYHPWPQACNNLENQIYKEMHPATGAGARKEITANDPEK
jgi:hypothetical protein